MNCLIEFYKFLQSNDLPNWIIFFFSIIIWPAILYFWNKRKRDTIKNLKVSLSKDSIKIDNTNLDAVKLTFTNSTSGDLFITNVRLKSKKENFKIHELTSRDFYSGYCELKFYDQNTKIFSIRDVILYTNKEVFTVIGVSEVNPLLFIYKSKWLNRFFRFYKYFILEYTILMNNKRYFIKTRF